MVVFVFLISVVVLTVADNQIVAADKYVQENDYQKAMGQILAELKGLRGEILSLKEENTDLVTEVKKLKTENTKLIKSVEIHTDQITALQRDTGEINSDMQRIRKELCENRYGTINKLYNNASVVSFTAFATEDRDYVEEELVQFDGIARNYGDAYNPEVSIFECPVNGYYLFFVSILAGGSSDKMGTELYMDGSDPLVKAYAIGSGDLGSTLAVSYCSTGELVWVKSTFDGSHMQIGAGGRYSSFTGTLLYTV